MMSAPPVYPHPSPVQSRMPVNGHAPIYGQSMWMPIPGGQPAQNPRVMRPLTSPYSVPYPSPNTPTLYAPPLPAVQNPPPQNGSQARGRNVPVMSPVMSHASAVPMYAASPVLMHAPVQMPQHAYMSMPPGRRNDVSAQSPMRRPMPIHSPSHNGYTPVPPGSFTQPTW